MTEFHVLFSSKEISQLEKCKPYEYYLYMPCAWDKLRDRLMSWIMDTHQSEDFTFGRVFC